MTMQRVTVTLPDDVYLRLRERATQAQRTVEDELLDVLGSALIGDDELSPDVATEVAGLEVLTDAALLRAARSARLPAVARALERLYAKRDSEGLTLSEYEEATTLLRQYERLMLLRAHALLLLKLRGRDVTDLMQRS